MWCRENTEKDDDFVTPAGSHSFRNLAFRASLNELRSELVWVKPTAFQKTRRRARSLEEIVERGGARVEDTFCVAAGWGARYVIARADRETAAEPVYENTDFRIFRIPEDACRSAESPS